MRLSGYQLDYLDKHLTKQDYLRTRKIKAAKILEILKRAGLQLRQSVICDVGCSTGIITSMINERSSVCVGIDIDRKSLSIAQSTAKNAYFVLADGIHLPFRSEAFDILICNHVLEHVPNQARLCSEILRALKKPNGALYLAVNNRFVLIEPHYKLPFLSWFPRRLSDFYLRITGKGTYYFEKLPTYWKLRKLLTGFQICDKTVEVIKSPSTYHVEEEIPVLLQKLLVVLPPRLLHVLMPTIPSWILIAFPEIRQGHYLDSCLAGE